MSATVVIEDSLIAKLIASQTAMAALPTLKTAVASMLTTPRQVGCRACQKRAKRPAVNYAQLKQVISGLPAQEKIRLKQLLKAGKVKVATRAGAIVF